VKKINRPNILSVICKIIVKM